MNDFRNAVRPVTGQLCRLTYRLDGQTRAQAWYCIGTLVWGPNGELETCTAMKRCPLEAALESIRKAQRALAKFSRHSRRAAARKGVAS